MESTPNGDTMQVCEVERVNERFEPALRRPRITVVTPSFNSEETIGQTIGSLAEQREFLDRYIIVDGASTDATLATVEAERSWFDDRILLSSEPDHGVYDAMNRGVSLALDGAADDDLIGIINSDDYYLPGALEAVASAAAVYPDVDMFYGDAQELSEHGVQTGNVRTSCDRLTPQQLIKDMCVQHPTVFLRARTYRSVGLFDREYRIAADYDLLFRVVESGATTLHVGRVIAAHREGGLSHRARNESLREAVDVRIAHGMSPIRAWIRHYLTQGWYRSYNAVRPYCAPAIDFLKGSNAPDRGGDTVG